MGFVTTSTYKRELAVKRLNVSDHQLWAWQEVLEIRKGSAILTRSDNNPITQCLLLSRVQRYAAMFVHLGAGDIRKVAPP